MAAGLRSILWRIAALVLSSTAVWASEPQPLRLAKNVVRHDVIALHANEAVEIDVVQLDGTLQIHAHAKASDSGPLYQNDAGHFGRTRLTLLGDAGTSWKVDIASRDGKPMTYRYKKGKVHLSTRDDRSRAAMEHALADIENLRRAAGTIEHGDTTQSASSDSSAARYESAAIAAAGDACFSLMIAASRARYEFARGNYPASRDFAMTALTFPCSEDDLSNIAERAVAQRTLGSALGYLGDFSGATAATESALANYRKTGDANYQAMTLANLSANYRTVGATQKALDAASSALVIADAIGDTRRAAFCRESIAAIHLQRGEYGAALDAYRETIDAVRRAPYPMIEAMAWNDMGLLYANVDERDDAAAAFRSAEDAWKRNADDNGLHETLLNEGELALAGDDITRATELFDRVLEFDVAHGLQREEAHTRGALARVNMRTGKFDASERELIASRDLARKIGAVTLEAAAELALGDLQRRRKHEVAADAHYSIAQTLAQKSNDNGAAIAAAGSRARIALDDGRAHDAEAFLRPAIALIEDERTHINAPDLRTAYFATQRSYYDVYIAALIALHDQESSRRALQLSESARARAFRETLLERKIDLTSTADPKLVVAERSAQDALREAAYQASAPTTVDAQRARRDVDAAYRQLDLIRGAVRAADPRFARVMQPSAVDVDAIQKELASSHSTVVEYWLGDAASVAWIITGDRVDVVSLAPRRQIDSLVDGALADITRTAAVAMSTSFEIRTTTAQADDANSSRAVQALRAIAFEPVAGKISDRNVIVIGDGELQRFPFALFGDRYRFTYLPSLSSFAWTLPTSMAGAMAVIGDPVVRADDPRLNAPRASSSASDYVPLVHAREEIERVAALRARADTWVATGFDASRSRVMESNASNFAMFHFAAHSTIDLRKPELSGIALSMFDASGTAQDGFLRMIDVYRLQLPAALVVLSVCDASHETGRGAEGIFGLSRAFFYAGARRVVLSLWPVDDAASSALMIAFYSHLFGDAPNPADALQLAQREIRNDDRWHAPYYWAGFVMQGDWR